MNQHTMVSRDDRWLGAWVGDELMMMDGKSGAYLSLSETAGRIWELLAQEKTVEELCLALGSEYQITPEQSVPEVMRFLNQMIEEKTVKIQERVGDGERVI